jgi:hypothetical protein
MKTVMQAWTIFAAIHIPDRCRNDPGMLCSLVNLRIFYNKMEAWTILKELFNEPLV